MNEIIRTYLKNLEKSVDAIEHALRGHRAQMQSQNEAYERLTQQYWGRGKELSILSDASARLESVSAENEKLRSAHEQVQAALQRVRDYVKDLSEALRQ